MIIAVSNFGLKRTVELDEMFCSYELYPTIYQLVVHCYSDWQFLMKKVLLENCIWLQRVKKLIINKKSTDLKILPE